MVMDIHKAFKLHSSNILNGVLAKSDLLFSKSYGAESYVGLCSYRLAIALNT